MTAAPVEVEVADAPGSAAVGEPVAVELIVRRGAGRRGPATLRQIDARPGSGAEVDADLFERDVAVGAGEAYRCTVRVTFTRPGPADLSQLYVEAADDAEGRSSLVALPVNIVAVVPSLRREVRVTVSRVCGYELGTKVEVEMTHVGSTPFADFRVAVGPQGRVRAGLCEHRRPEFAPGDALRFDAVVAGVEVELGLDADAAGAPAGPVQVALPVPAGAGEARGAAFRFLEPRRLSTDAVTLYDKATGREVSPVAGAFPVAGAESKYLAVVRPSHPQASRVVLHSDLPRVGVTDPRRLEGGGWEFPLTVSANPLLTAPVRLYYDVTVPGRTLRGELYFSVRPTWARQLTLAATLGVAFTVKGVTGLVSAAISQEGVAEDAPLIFASRNFGYALSIPAIGLGLRAVDALHRWAADE